MYHFTIPKRRRGRKSYPECIPGMVRAGLSETDAFAVRRIAMQLHRWHELECGVESGGVERDEETGKCVWYSSFTGRRSPYPDRETPALKRLAAIMTRYPALTPYVQGDPRGAPLYLIREGDVPAGLTVDACYSRGIAVHK